LTKKNKIFCYNNHTLKFEEVRISAKKSVLHFFGIFFSAILLSGIAGSLLYHFAFAPEKYILSKKITFSESEMNRLSNVCDSVGLVLTAYYFPQDNIYRTILGMDTMPLTMRNAGSGGSDLAWPLSGNESLSYNLKTKINQLDRQMDIQLNSFLMLKATAMETGKKHSAIPAIQPIACKDLLMISSYFGKRLDPFLLDEALHYGLDFVAPAGSNVYATGDGIVTLLKYSRTGYGNELVINHSFGYSTRYAHLEKFFVSEGESVKRGQLIALVGNSGRSTGPHLHYEVRYEGKPVNPIFYYSDDLTDSEFFSLTNKTLAKPL